MTSTSTLTFDGTDTEWNAQPDVALTNGTTITGTWAWHNNDRKPQDRIYNFNGGQCSPQYPSVYMD
jgi:hypothetical protein